MNVLNFKTFIAESATAAKINATQFEVDLVKAFNELSTEGTERGRKLKYQNAGAERAAKSCVRAIVPQMDGEPRVAYRTGGKANPNVLTPAYTQGGPGKSVKSGEPKTDIVFISGSTKYRCSVKNGAAAQIASAQTNEMYAVLNAVYTGGKGAMVARTLSQIIQQTGNEAVYKATRERFKREFGEDSFDALLSRVAGLKSGAGVATASEIQQMNKFLKVLGIKERLTLEMSEFMNKRENRVALLREFATGELRFTNPDFIATHFLEWFGNGTARLHDVDTFLRETLPRFKFSIRDRGRKSSKSGGGSRGAALRIDFTTPKKLQEQRYEAIREELHEGLRDWYASAKATIGKGWQMIVRAVSKIVDFFAGLLSGGFSALLSFLDIEPVEMEYSW